ncbi:MAG TPA: TRAP transporter small permease [Burkholderiales bacterium]
MKKFLAAAEAVLDFVGTVLVGLSLAAISIQVFYRYVLNDATTWSDTVAATSLAWMTFIAGTAAVRRNENIAVGFLVERFGPKGRKLVDTFGHLVVLAFALALTYSGLILMDVTRSAVVEGFGFHVTWAQFYSISVVSGVLMTLFTLERLASLWRRA